MKEKSKKQTKSRKRTLIQLGEHHLLDKIANAKKEIHRLQLLVYQAYPNRLRNLPKAILKYIISFLDSRPLDVIRIRFEQINLYCKWNEEKTQLIIYDKKMCISCEPTKVLSVFEHAETTWLSQNAWGKNTTFAWKFPLLGTKRYKKPEKVHINWEELVQLRNAERKQIMDKLTL